MNALGVEYSAFKTFLVVGNHSRNIQLDGPKSLFAFNNIYIPTKTYIFLKLVTALVRASWHG